MKQAEVNKRILEKIKDLKIDENVKTFLTEIIYWEMNHSHEKMPRFKEDYLKKIEKCCRLET